MPFPARALPPLLRKWRGIVVRRARTGARRSAGSALAAAWMAAAAVGSYWMAEELLGHTTPIFAATSCMVALGFSHGPRLPRVMEIMLGCTLGIAVSDLLLHWLGAGVPQAGVVLFVSVLLARFLASGTLFATQMGLQAALLVLLPMPGTGPFTRSLDALVGGTVALLVALLTSGNPQRVAGQETRSVLLDLSGLLRGTARALERRDIRGAREQLRRARNTQPDIDDLNEVLSEAKETTRLSPAHIRRRAVVERLESVGGFTDLAMRNTRILTRMSVTAVRHDPDGGDPSLDLLAMQLRRVASAVDLLAEGLVWLRPKEKLGLNARLAVPVPDQEHDSHDVLRARALLADVAGRLDARSLGLRTVEGQAALLVLRQLVTDLLRACGLTPEESSAHFPPLD